MLHMLTIACCLVGLWLELDSVSGLVSGCAKWRRYEFVKMGARASMPFGVGAIRYATS